MFPTLVQVLILDLFKDGHIAQRVLVVFSDLAVMVGANAIRQLRSRPTAEVETEGQGEDHSRATPGYDHRSQPFILFLPIPHQVAIKNQTAPHPHRQPLAS